MMCYAVPRCAVLCPAVQMEAEEDLFGKKKKKKREMDMNKMLVCGTTLVWKGLLGP